MTDAFQALQAALSPSALKDILYPPTSRYHGAELATMGTADGRSIVHLKRRFVPAPEELSLIQEHTVVQGDRLDNLAHKYLGDPEQFWQIGRAHV